MSGVVHIVEPGGRGGIHQHAVSFAGRLHEAGVDVVLHTAGDAEELPSRVVRRACFWPFASVRPDFVRRALFVAGWLLCGVPSCLAGVSRRDVLHIEGRFRPILLVPLVLAARARRCTLTFNPHATFPRMGRASQERIVRWIARRADAVMALSDYDLPRVEAWGARAVRIPLLLPAPAPSPELVRGWRRRWHTDEGRRAVLLAGQLRADKGPDLLVRAAALIGNGVVVTMVGEDLGAGADVRALAAELGVNLIVDEGYVPFERFLAALAAADVVACPYRVASQSAVLALARALGRPTVATSVGGLSELAAVVVRPEDPAALAAGVQDALGIAPRPVPAEPGDDGVGPFLDATGLGVQKRTGALP